MANLRRAIPTLGALATFEAAARLASFTLAATELGVTQAAVSRQIKQLETELNTPLFTRAHRKVALTAQGAALATALTGSFQRIAEVIDTIRRPASGDSVSVGATLAFTHLWLLPRLSVFRADHPDIRLRLVAEDSGADLRRDKLDLVIRYGAPPFDDGRSVASLPDEVFPVCSPVLLDRLGMTAETAHLPAMPLLASDWVDPTWLTWKSWAKLAAFDPALAKASDKSRLRFNHYTDTVQAAVNGEGVALGWAALIAGLLAEGRLVRLSAPTVTLAARHHLLEPAGRDASPAAAVFRDWISGQFAANP